MTSIQMESTPLIRKKPPSPVWFYAGASISTVIVVLALVEAFGRHPAPHAKSPHVTCDQDNCLRLSHRTNLYSLCFAACPWLSKCAWQAVNQLPEVCAGTFEPSGEDCGCRTRTCEAVVSYYDSNAAERALEDLDSWCDYIGVPKKWTAPMRISDSILQSEWGSGLDIEEHYLYGKPALLSSVFIKQAYAFWRYVLKPPVRAVTRGYFSREALVDALRNRQIKKGALVFVDVLFEAMDTQWDYEELKNIPGILEKGDLEASELSAGDPRRALDFLCVYQHTPDILRRSSLLRALLSYEEPLVLVLAGDADCRLQLPRTHHFYIFPNDGAHGPLWWPEGLEGLNGMTDLGPIQSAGGFAHDALAKSLEPKQRPYLINTEFTVTPRKPSRITLLDYLKVNGSSLEALASANDLLFHVRARVSRIDDDPPYTFAIGNSSDAGALFALCPAGDTWTSGRILEALLQGTVPIVDATYLTDGISMKGCADPARFWRHGSDAFPHPAPFVFIDDWHDLPDKLERALDHLDMDALHKYKNDLISYLRDTTLGYIKAAQQSPASSSSTCKTTPLNATEHRAQIANAAAYYETDWFASFPDSPELPGSGCTTKYYTDGRKQHGALCFDAACAPPLVSSFRC